MTEVPAATSTAQSAPRTAAPPAATSSAPTTRERIVGVAARLLQEEGAAALTTRGVAQAAGVQAPAIYRLFGDKDGLLEAVAEHVMTTYVTAKAAIVESAEADGVDPVDDLRAGWRSQIAFGLANPELFRLVSDPDRVRRSPAAQSGRGVLEARVHRVALAGRLAVSEPLAVDLISAAGVGAVITTLAKEPADRDPALPNAAFEAVLAQILVAQAEGSGTRDPARSPAGPRDATLAAAVTLRAAAPTLDALSAAERALLGDWLGRVLAD